MGSRSKQRRNKSRSKTTTQPAKECFGNSARRWKPVAFKSMTKVGFVPDVAWVKALAFIMVFSAPAFAADYEERQPNGLLVSTTWEKGTPDPVNPWKAMEEKERADRAEIERLTRRARMTYTPQPEPQRPTPGIIVRGNQALTLKDLQNHPLPSPGEAQEPESEPKGLVGPQMGWKGPRREYTHHAGSHISTWRYLPQQKERK